MYLYDLLTFADGSVPKNAGDCVTESSICQTDQGYNQCVLLNMLIYISVIWVFFTLKLICNIKLEYLYLTLPIII